MAFKMKGNPMKRNFGIGDKPMTKINRGDDKGNPTAAFQKHDGKTFDDPGFMDSHFPSGAPRPMKLKKESATKLMKDKSAMKLMNDKSPAKIAKVGKKAISMAEKPVTATTKAMSKRKARRAAKKAGKGNVVTTVQSATKMKKKSPMTIKKDSAMDMKKPMKMKKKSAMKLMKDKSPAKLISKTNVRNEMKKVEARRAAKKGFTEGKSEMMPKASKKKPTYTDEFGKEIAVKKSAMKKTTYMLKKGGKKVKVSKAEYEKVLGGKAGSKLNKQGKPIPIKTIF